MERNVGDARMKVDGRLPYGLSTLWARFIGKQGQRHREFLFAPGELRTLKRVQLLGYLGS
jgi:hypothetical protein